MVAHVEWIWGTRRKIMLWKRKEKEEEKENNVVEGI